jgi:hypothetical protein
VLPTGWGNGEFTLTLYIRPMQAGSTAWGTVDIGSTVTTKKRRWCSDNTTLYSSTTYWTPGNFLLDGYNNGANPENGGFSLQLTNTGRLQWLFGDGAAAGARTGDTHCIRGTTNIIDGNAHRIDLVRRDDGAGGSILELWVDGNLEGTETSTAFTTMYTTYWDDWAAFPSNERFWMIGAEKFSVLNGAEWEDYMGDLFLLAFWDTALAEEDLERPAEQITATDDNLVGFYRFEEQTGTTCADLVGDGGDITLVTNTDNGPLWINS